MEFELGDAFVETPNGTSTGALVKCPFYLNPRKRVNTILTHFVRRRAQARSDIGRRLYIDAMRQRTRAPVQNR